MMNNRIQQQARSTSPFTLVKLNATQLYAGVGKRTPRERAAPLDQAHGGERWVALSIDPRSGHRSVACYFDGDETATVVRAGDLFVRRFVSLRVSPALPATWNAAEVVGTAGVLVQPQTMLLRLWDALPAVQWETRFAAWAQVQEPVAPQVAGATPASPILLVHLGEPAELARFFASNNNTANAGAVPIDIFGVHPEDPGGEDFTTTLRQSTVALATLVVPAAADGNQPVDTLIVPDGFHEFVIVPQATAGLNTLVVGFRASMR